MLMVNIYDAKARLSEYLEAVSRGERVLICKRNRPVAELRAVDQKRTAPRPIGGEKGVVVRPSFFEPLPDELLDAFDAGPVYPTSARQRSRVAKPGAPYTSARSRKRRR
jgi:antitoxin (DNA-binding transcriptional repressor) of toxin-antitoxin stability system